jgi:hypothetical protein
MEDDVTSGWQDFEVSFRFGGTTTLCELAKIRRAHPDILPMITDLFGFSWDGVGGE